MGKIKTLKKKGSLKRDNQIQIDLESMIKKKKKIAIGEKKNPLFFSSKAKQHNISLV